MAARAAPARRRPPATGPRERRAPRPGAPPHPRPRPGTPARRAPPGRRSCRTALARAGRREPRIVAVVAHRDRAVRRGHDRVGALQHADVPLPAASRRAIASRCAASSSPVQPSSRAASPACGVITVGAARPAIRPRSVPIACRPSASSTSGPDLGHEAPPAPPRYPGARPQTGAERDHAAPGGPFQDQVGGGLVEAAVGLGAPQCHRLQPDTRHHRLLRRRYGRDHDPGAGAQRSPRAERDRAGHAPRAADRTLPASYFEPCAGRAGRAAIVAAPASTAGGSEPRRPGSRSAPPPGRRHREAGQDHVAELRGMERDRHVRRHRDRRRLAGRRVDAARHVDGHHRCAGAADRADRLDHRATRLAAAAGAEQRVDHDLRAAQPLADGADPEARDARGDGCVAGRERIAGVGPARDDESGARRRRARAGGALRRARRRRSRRRRRPRPRGAPPRTAPAPRAPPPRPPPSISSPPGTPAAIAALVGRAHRDGVVERRTDHSAEPSQVSSFWRSPGTSPWS